MRLAAPTSKASIRWRVTPADVIWAVCAPFVAIALRDPALLDAVDFPQKIPAAYEYAFVTVACAIPAFLLFRVSEGMSHLFSVQDVLAVCAAVLSTVAASGVVLFVFTRLEGVPRSTPLIYGLVLGAGMILSRTFARGVHKVVIAENAGGIARDATSNVRRVLLIGVDRFAALAIKLIDAQRPRATQIVAALDSRPSYRGRTVSGVKIVGDIDDLAAVIDEYIVHGVEIDAVWLSDETVPLPGEVVERMSAQCDARGVPLVRISEALNLAPLPPQSAPCAEPPQPMGPSEYFRLKRYVDPIVAGFLLILLAPLALAVAGLVLLDVGAPAMFWQLRIGRNGRRFLLHKFRTYHAPFDRNGVRIPEPERLSRLGRVIRASRLDEIPQLLNVLVGDMSLIGPRPLLPHDQPRDPRMRLLVRPGITGWAQVNGGRTVTPEEKDALDVWYIRHASVALDATILLRTIVVALLGERTNKAVISEAVRWREEKLAAAAPLPRQALVTNAERDHEAGRSADPQCDRGPGEVIIAPAE